MMRRSWEPAAADEWLPQKLRLTFSGPGGDSGPDSDAGPSPGDYTGSDPSSFDAGAGFQGTDSGTGFQSTSPSSSDGGPGYSSSDSYSGDGGYYSGDTSSASYQGSDTGGGYFGGSSLGGNVSADVAGTYGGGYDSTSGGTYGGGSPQGGGPFGGGGFQGPGGFQDSTTGQGFGLFTQNQQGELPAGTLDALTNSTAMPTINIASPYEGPLAGPDVMAGGRGPGLDTQLGVNDIGNQQALQTQQQANDPLANYLDSNMQAQVNDPTNAWQQAVNTVSQLNIDPQAQMIAAQEVGRQNEGIATSGRGGEFQAPFAGRSQSGMDMEFNPFGTYQAPAQDQGRQGSLMDMLNAINPISRAEAQNLWNIDPVTGQMPDTFNARFGGPYSDPAAPMSQNPFAEMGQTGSRSGDVTGQRGLAPENFNARFGEWNYDPSLQAAWPVVAQAPYAGPLAGPDVMAGARGERADTFNARFGDLPPAVNVNEAPYVGPLAGPDVVGDRSQAPPQADTFDSRFGDIQQQSQDARPGWDIGQQLAGVRGGSELFAQAPQNVQQALQAGNPYGQMQFASMPWGTTFAQPQLATVDPSTVAFNNFLTQTQNQQASPWNDQQGKTLDQLRAEQLQRDFDNRTMFDPTLFGPPQQFQPQVARPADVPTPVANPLNLAERGALPVADPRSRGERGPQDVLQPVSRAVERAVTERAPVAERNTAPLQVTVPGRVGAPPTQSRSSDTRSQSRSSDARSNAPNVSRGQLDGLLNQARTAPTLAGRIQALDQLNGIISAMRSAGLPNPYGRDPDPNVAAALRMGR